MKPTVIDRLARALHAADRLAGNTPSGWSEIGEMGQDSYRNDAAALLKVAPTAGLQIREVQR